MKRLLIVLVVMSIVGSSLGMVSSAQAQADLSSSFLIAADPEVPDVPRPAPDPPAGGDEGESPDPPEPPNTGPPIYNGDFINGDSDTTLNPENYNLSGLAYTLLPTIANWIAGILAVVGVIFLIVAGFQFLTAGGEEEQITKAAKSAFYVLAGLVLVMFAYSLVYLFLTLLTSS